MIDRLGMVEGIAANADFLKGPLVSALVNCLNIDELTKGLLKAHESTPLFRRALIRTLSRDPHKSAEVQRRVFGTLVNRLERANYRDARTIAYVLSELTNLDMQLEDPHHVLTALFDSRFAIVRSIGYKVVRRYLDDHILNDLLKQVWRKFNDPLCASLVVNNMPIEFLLEEFEKLDSTLNSFLSRSRLYIRVAEKDPTVLDRLKESDEVAWTYAKVKLGHPPLAPKDARALFWRNDTHPELALLLWCFGQMYLWQVLLEIASHQDYFNSSDYFERKYRVHFPRPNNVNSNDTLRS